MRHHNKNKKFGRETKQRHALINGLCVALIERGQIKTTLAKAKTLRRHIEPLVTRAKVDSLSNRRLVLSSLMNNKKVTEKLFKEVAGKYSSTPGGYTRIIKLPTRLLDAAPMAIIEFV